ncbi:major facilitator superfamily MFS_1 [Kribbella flavida DSM 17836]|uniref:Major facilitator superfamily MFS_1 n=1 Tax=Kribbella flavida (strain DSM 17836 / JCM 10339 / NBRC 14399) TaxID=479435 RepID=D2PRK6_KRIFD|nr:MFS transporter [Kribbella flavida]ADB34924.1 major facilitator superfamily MFS_1 [Kribbella flavida DSM 17836]
MQSPDPADRPRTEQPRRAATGSAPGAGSPSGGSGRSPGAGAGGSSGGGAGGRGGGPKDGQKRAGERLSSAGQRLGSAGRKVGHASKVGAGGFATISKKTAGFTGRAGKATGRRIRGLTSAQGAGESGLSRLIELGAVNAAGDTAFAVSLAGTVFFAVPSEQARDRVALFLLLTMAPFALMAPLIGPILDRFRHGRRWAIGATLGLRGFLVWSLAASIHDSSTWLYPAALGCLVASKAYGVTRASAVPRLLPNEISLVTANSRISLAGVAGATVGAGIAGAFAAIGPEWSLRWAALVYTVGLVLAIRLPSKVDSPAGQEMLGSAGREARRRAITAAVSRGIRCNLGLRFVSGFLTMYLAFLLRDKPISGLDGALAAGAVIAAAGLGNSLGTLTGSLLKARKPEIVVLVVLLADATIAICVAVFYGFPTLILLGLVAGLCSSLGKLSLDAMIQRDVPETVRTSVFARSETVLQLSWVIGGGCGIVLPLIPRLGFGFLAAVLIAVIILVIRHQPAPQPQPPSPGPSGSRTRPQAPEPGPGSGSTATSETRAERVATARTVMTSPDDPTERISERRARGPRTDAPERSNEPTVELRVDPDGNPKPSAIPDAAAGRWWSGHPDDDETEIAPTTWSEEPTVERTAEQPAADRGTSRRTAEPDDETRVERRPGLFRRRPR